MQLKKWLTRNHKNQKWLAQQLGVTEGRVSQAFKGQREGNELPRAWAADIVRITEGEVRLQDEWPKSRRKQERAVDEAAA